MGNMTLAVHCKKSDPVDLKKPMWNYVASTYSQQQANDAMDDLGHVQQLRNTVCNLTGSLSNLRDTLARYYRALGMMETRFPVGRDSDQVHLSFVWYDAFKPTKRAEAPSIHLERAAVLFNIGAVLTQQALGCDSSSDSGMKEAARKFQEAAGAFAALRDGPALHVESPRPVDLTPECAAMLERLCLAQAQEAIFDKARADRKNPATLARLARQVSVFYEEVHRLLMVQPLNSHFDKSWTAHVAVKLSLYDLEAQLQSAEALHADDDIAPEIARLREASKNLQATKRDIKLVGRELNEALATLEGTLIKNLNRAERENETVYLQRIPDVKDLPRIAPAPLVKPIAPADLSSDGDGLFTSVIPDSSAKALSKYTDMVDSSIRGQLDKLAAASDDARLRLREWELPDCLQALDAGSSQALPEGLRGELEQLEEHGGVAHLQDLAAQIQELRKVAGQELTNVEQDLDRESREDSELKERYGPQWNRPGSAALNSTLREKIAGYKANLVAAADSDARLESRLTQNQTKFNALSLDLAISQMPRLQAPMVSTGDVEPAVVVTNLRKAMDAIGSLSSERASLEQALKEEKGRDNILPKLMAANKTPETLFQEELQKYEPIKAKVTENLQKQAQLMEVINKNQAAYRQAFGYDEWRRACEAAASGMRGQLATYKDLRDNLSEGLRFYMSVQEAIAVLRQQAGDYILTRRLQRDDMIEDMRRVSDDRARQDRDALERQARERAQSHLASMSLQSSGSQQQPPPPNWPSAPNNYPPSYQGGPGGQGRPAQDHQAYQQQYSGPPVQQGYGSGQSANPSYSNAQSGNPNYPPAPQSYYQQQYQHNPPPQQYQQQPYPHTQYQQQQPQPQQSSYQYSGYNPHQQQQQQPQQQDYSNPGYGQNPAGASSGQGSGNPAPGASTQSNPLWGNR